MVTPSERVTPLATYLEREGISNAEFAARLSRTDGRSVDPAVVSMWRNALRVPGFASRRLIAAASDGQIPATAWANIVARKPRRSPRKYRRTG